MRLVRWFAGGAVIALILVFAALVWIDRSTPVHVVVSSETVGDIRVHIAGAVATPGVVTLPANARLVDAVNASGGFADDADVTSLNLAGRVGNGEHVTIPATNLEATPATGSQSPADTEGAVLLDINTATAGELEALPGIGEVLSVRIVEYREQNGPFSSVDELANVDGISAGLIDELRPLVTVDDGS